MAMVFIEKDGKTIKIPAGAYNSQYAPAGWKLAKGSKVKTEVEEVVEEVVEETTDEATEDAWAEVEEDEVEEKSVDDMDMEELRKKAKELKINTRDLTTVGALRKAIKKAMNN